MIAVLVFDFTNGFRDAADMVAIAIVCLATFALTALRARRQPVRKESVR